MDRSFLKKRQSFGNALQFDLLIERSTIQERLRVTAQKLETLYKGKELTIIMLMKGAFFLVADLMRLLHLPICVEFLHCSSYGDRGIRKGELQISGLERLQVEAKHILIVDDVFDTGHTLSEVFSKLKQKKPASLSSLVLLTKNVPHQTSYRPDFSLFDIEDCFVVGYGLDYKEYYRGLPDIYAINP